MKDSYGYNIKEKREFFYVLLDFVKLKCSCS